MTTDGNGSPGEKVRGIKIGSKNNGGNGPEALPAAGFVETSATLLTKE